MKFLFIYRLACYIHTIRGYEADRNGNLVKGKMIWGSWRSEKCQLPKPAGIIEKRLPAPLTTRPGGADQDGHPGGVKRRGSGDDPRIYEYSALIKLLEFRKSIILWKIINSFDTVFSTIKGGNIWVKLIFQKSLTYTKSIR